MTVSPFITPSLRSLHTSFLEAFEYGKEFVNHPRFRAWTHPDDDRVWHLTDCSYIQAAATLFASSPTSGLLTCFPHGIAGETTSGKPLWGFQTKQYTPDDQKVARLSAFRGSLNRQGTLLDNYVQAVQGTSLLEAAHKLVLLKGLNALNGIATAIDQTPDFEWTNSLVGQADGGILVHPSVFSEAPDIPF